MTHFRTFRFIRGTRRVVLDIQQIGRWKALTLKRTAWQFGTASKIRIKTQPCENSLRISIHRDVERVFRISNLLVFASRLVPGGLESKRGLQLQEPLQVPLDPGKCGSFERIWPPALKHQLVGQVRTQIRFVQKLTVGQDLQHQLHRCPWNVKKRRLEVSFYNLSRVRGLDPLLV